MLNRLANAFYWLGALIAALSLLLSVYLYYEYQAGGAVGDGNLASYVMAAFAFVAYGTGWVFRYVVTGRKR
jgi:hypothetical protein